MDEVKLKVLTSVASGIIKLNKSYNEYFVYKNSANNNKLDLGFQLVLKSKYEVFQINLYNCARAILDKKTYFDYSYKIENLFSKEITIIDWRDQQEKAFKFGDLFKAFRNRNAHFDKTNKELEYILFKNNTSLDFFNNLYLLCIEIVEIELAKLTDEELAGVYFYNVDINMALEKMIDIALNMDFSDKSLKFREMLNFFINEYKLLHYDNVSQEEVDKSYKQTIELLKDKECKKILIDEVGIDFYNEIMTLFDNEDVDLDYIIEKLTELFNKLIIQRMNEYA